MFIVGLLIALGVGFWVKSDHDSLAAQGTKVGSMGGAAWFWGVFLLLIVFLPLYLIQRSRAVQLAEQQRRMQGGYGYPPPPGFPPPPPAQPPYGSQEPSRAHGSHCGRALAPQASFCPACGTRIQTDQHSV